LTCTRDPKENAATTPMEWPMSDKARSRVADFLVYLAVRITVCVVQALSFDAGCAFARLLAWLAYRLDKRHRLVAQENLELAFPGKYSGPEMERMVRDVYRHFCRVVIELAHLQRRLHVSNWKRYVELRDCAGIIEALLSDRPLLVVTGHFGNWEVAGYVLGLLGFKTHAIARPLDNPYVDDFFRRFRERTGQKLLAKRGDFDRIEQVLSAGGVLATLADQDAGARGLFVDFFGRPASTHKAIALLAMEHNVPMLVAATPFLDGKHVICGSEVIEPADYQKTPNAVRAITQRFTAELEQLVRLAPQQYFWLHRRWKHQPARKGRKAA
jgi:Kdo2-lipid IVA lauroyltransferase/acyltransferase